MSDGHDGLRELYQELILDHGRRPRNFHETPGADHSAEGHNPLCGDQLMVFLRIDQGRVADASFVGHGCAISTASASLMTEAVRGLTVGEADSLFRDVHAMLTGEPAPGRAYGKLAVLAGVRDYPARVKCATLAWHTLHNALAGDGQAASTE